MIKMKRFQQSLRVTNEYLEDLELCGRLMKEEKNDPLLQERGETMAICVECEYYKAKYKDRSDECMNRDLPISDFVDGSRWCYTLNPEGNCKGFKAKSKPEPIIKETYARS